MDDALEGAVEAGVIPGVVALAADENGVTYQGAFGKRALGGDADMTLDTLFFIASMTKAVTSVAAMQLVEQGRVTLDEPLGERAPELGRMQVLEGFDADGQAKLRPARGPITLRQLLTHTAGCSSSNWNATMLRWVEQNAQAIVDGGPRAILTAPLVFDPGTGWEYGSSTDWVGQIVELVSGERLDQYVYEHVTGPLGMPDTRFHFEPVADPRLASMHRRHPDGTLEVVPFHFPQSPELVRGAGGLHSTGPDYLRFVRMLIGQGTLEGTQILQPQTVADMARNQMGDIDMPVMRTSAPPTSNDFDPFPGMQKKWGLGFVINTERSPWGRSAGSLAWGGIANSYYWIDPTKRVGGLIMTQILPFADTTVLETFGRFERAVYGG
jgi:CubicO group peptidase (beta-lactamase class C family)